MAQMIALRARALARVPAHGDRSRLPDVPVAALQHIREWIRGTLPLGEADPREYFVEVPRTEYASRSEAVSIPLPSDWNKEEDSDG